MRPTQLYQKLNVIVWFLPANKNFINSYQFNSINSYMYMQKY